MNSIPARVALLMLLAACAETNAPLPEPVETLLVVNRNAATLTMIPIMPAGPATEIALNAPPGGQAGGTNQIGGGLIFFGGGVPIYQGTKLVGGLGISGDTSCADHEIAKRTRNELGMNPPGGALVDDITYSVPDGASVFTHPRCINTWRNGAFIGEEAVASGY